MRLHPLVDQLEAMIREAKETPILGGARIDRDAIYEIVDELRLQVLEPVPLDEDRIVRRGAGLLVPLDELDDVVHGAKTVPLTDSVRVDRDQVLEIIGRIRRGAGQDQVVARGEIAPPVDRRKLRELIERLDALVRGARPVPLTTQVRIEPQAVREILDEMREAAPAALLPAIDGFDEAVLHSFPVPLTSQVRVERDRLTEIIQQMRTGFSQGTPPALTN